MKVLLISVWKPRKGGIVTHVENLLKHSRNSFTILTYRDRKARKEPGVIRVPIVDIPVLRGITFTLFSFLRALRKNFDLIHAHYAMPQGLAGALIKKTRKKPFVITVHGSDLTVLGESRLYRPVLKWVFNEADAIIAVSRHIEKLLTGLGVDARKINVIYSGVDPQPPAVEGERRVVFIGALVWQKGVDTLIEAFKDIKRSFPDATLVIVGDGGERENLESQAQRLGLKDILFTGYLEDLDNIFTSQTVLVLPSRKEGFGLTLLEAMARGVPVVGSKSGGIPEIIHDGRNGYLFSTGNFLSLADAVKKIFANDDVRARLINGGLETVKNFTWSQTSEETDDVYEKISTSL